MEGGGTQRGHEGVFRRRYGLFHVFGEGLIRKGKGGFSDRYGLRRDTDLNETVILQKEKKKK